jgi:imidazolonepropionase-like amidohydrolase
VKKIVLIAMAAGLAGSAVAAPKFECDRSPLLVKNVDFWTPNAKDPQRDVLIVDGRIRQIAEAGTLQAPAGARVVDGNDQLMLPGLVDMHTHFVFPTGGFHGERKVDPAVDALTFGRQMLAAGVTSARVHLDSIEHARLLQDLSRDECAPMPRLQLGGPAFIPGTGTGDQYPVWDVAGVDDAIAKVRRGAELGFQWIAIHEPQKFPDDARAAIIDTARKLQVRILASGYTQTEMQAALAIAPDTLDYLDVSTTPEYPAALLDGLRAQKQLTWVARIGIHDRFRAYQDNPALIDDETNYEFFDAETTRVMKETVHKVVADRNSDHSKRMDAAYPTMHRKFQQALASGIPLAMGTDVGSPGQFHRDAIWWEFNSWVKLGASVDTAVIANINGAKLLHGAEADGLRVGARGDFVLCPSNTLRKRPIDGRGCQGYRSGLIAKK